MVDSRIVQGPIGETVLLHEQPLPVTIGEDKADIEEELGGGGAKPKACGEIKLEVLCDGAIDADIYADICLIAFGFEQIGIGINSAARGEVIFHIDSSEIAALEIIRVPLHAECVFKTELLRNILLR